MMKSIFQQSNYDILSSAHAAHTVEIRSALLIYLDLYFSIFHHNFQYDTLINWQQYEYELKIEDHFPPLALVAGVLLFPLGLIICCALKVIIGFALNACFLLGLFM